MEVLIDKSRCLGCGMCVGINSDVFEFDDDGLAKTNNDKITEENEKDVKEAKDSCPVKAIEEKED